MAKNYPLNQVKEVKSISDLMNQAVKEVPNKIAFMYKVGKENKEVTYQEFQNDTIALGTALVEKRLTKNILHVLEITVMSG